MAASRGTARSRIPGALARARDAWRAGDLGAARDALVEAWRARRSPALAELAALLDPHAPDDLTARLAVVITPRAATSLAHLTALADVDDPRLATFALDRLVALPFTAASAQGFLVALLACAVRHRDPRLAARAPAIEAAIRTRIGPLAIRTKLVGALAKGVAALPPVPAPTAAERALEAELAALAEPLRAGARSIDALLAEVYAHPDDDAPRLVLADALAASLDPVAQARGELIVLQLARGDAPPSERERALLKQHGKAWLGALAPVLSWGKGYSDTTFRRGFVAHADVILSVGKKLRPILTDPAWATVETIGGLYGDDDDLLGRAPLRALRAVELVDEAHLARLAARAEPLAAVTTVELNEPMPAALIARAFPNLATVKAWARPITPAVIAAFAVAPHVELACGAYEAGALAAARAEVAAVIAALVGTAAPCARLTIVEPFAPRQEPTRVELVRDAAGAWRHT